MREVYGDKAADAWRKLAPKVVTVTQGWSEAYDLFLKGEADMVLSYTTSPAYHIGGRTRSDEEGGDLPGRPRHGDRGGGHDQVDRIRRTSRADFCSS